MFAFIWLCSWAEIADLNLCSVAFEHKLVEFSLGRSQIYAKFIAPKAQN